MIYSDDIKWKYHGTPLKISKVGYDIVSKNLSQKKMCKKITFMGTTA